MSIDKNIIKSIIKEMIENDEITISLKTFKYCYDYDDKVTSAECVKNILDEVDIVIEVDGE